jgi:adenylate cyclase
MLSIVYYLSSYIILTFYGSEVCPFLESLGFYQLSVNLAIFFIFAYGLHHLALRYFVNNLPLVYQAKRQFIVEMGIFLILGLAITIYDMIIYQFPLGSGLKIIFGSAVLGFFASLNLSLEKEEKTIRWLNQSKEKGVLSSQLFSLPRKFLVITIIGTVFISITLLLMVVKDFQWLAANLELKGVLFAKRSVIFEILFTVGVLLVLGINLIYSYSKNLKLYFENETRVLKGVAVGNLDNYVPVVTADEFGIIASNTNFMIDGLREKNRLKEIFGKAVSPAIAKRLLEMDNDSKIKLGGSRQNLVILFSDIRNFTSLTEKTDPEHLLSYLNRYFTELVIVIQSNNGLVDKFIGDGILAVFGLEGEDKAVDNAVKSAIDMQKTVSILNKELNIRMDTGVGIHKGDVIAGIIGSPDRLEFSFIGDTVNTASRLEELTKTLGAPILISSSCYEELSQELRSYPWEDFGNQSLKGKEKGIRAIGLKTLS